MNITHRKALLGLGALSLAASLAQSADLQPMVVGNFTGQLHIHQGIPCGSVDKTTPIAAGVLELTPAEGLDVAGGKKFILTRAQVSFAPFSISGSCSGFGDTRNYTAVGSQLDRAVAFIASPGAGGVWNVVIPKGDILFYEAATVNGDPETGYKQPIEDVTGTINLTTGTVTMHVVLGTSVRFQAGCVEGHCVIDETDSGTLTTDLTGTAVFPDADHDGVPDRTDNCRLTANPDQTPVATPVVIAPPNVTLNSCASHDIGTAAASDVCDATSVVVSNNAPTTFLVGNNIVTWTGQDAKARTGTATQVVTVVDTTAPVFVSVPPNVLLNDCKAAALGTPVVTDDCAGTPAVTNNAPPIFYVGTTPVTWTATDASGNQSTATQNVTVVDTTPPTVSCVLNNPTGNTFIVSASDACGAATVRLGGFEIANGERIKIEETGQNGVRLIDVVNGVRHFHVGKGQAIVTATDGSGNVSSATCK
jgi:hypothetical protein